MVLGLAGCDQSQTVGQCGDGVAAVDDIALADGGAGNIVVPDDASGALCDEVTQTTFAAAGMGDFVILCSVCDVGKCDTMGDSCDAYGSLCDFNGSTGVCVGCCNGIMGELRCSPIP